MISLLSYSITNYYIISINRFHTIVRTKCSLAVFSRVQSYTTRTEVGMFGEVIAMASVLTRVFT